jgi:pimeloyl-ACP methyl ester carboxylesterase
MSEPTGGRAGHRPLAVLVHGYSCTHTHWSGVLARMDEGIDSVVVSLPGHDDSPLPEGRLDMSACASHVLDRLGAIGRQGVVLIGHSLGGMIGMICVHERPELFRGLVLVDAFPKLGPPEPFNRSFWDGSPPELKWEIVAGMKETRRRLPETLWESVVAFDGTPLLAGLQRPVRGIYGDRGHPHESALRERVMSTGLGRAPDVEVYIVGQAGHFVMLERPRAFCGVLSSVVADLAGR